MLQVAPFKMLLLINNFSITACSIEVLLKWNNKDFYISFPESSVVKHLGWDWHEVHQYFKVPVADRDESFHIC